MALTDLTRISTSGIATGSTIDSPILRKDVSLRGSQVGVTSALFDSSDDALEFNDNVKLTFGNDGDLKLYHNGSHSFIDETGMGNLYIRNGTKNSIWCQTDGQVNLYHNDVKKFETAETGAVVTGILTATSFSGPILGSPINNPSGISTFYDVRVTNNLTVEGTTTTLDTNLIGVDRVEVGANSNTVTGIAVTQSGTADIVRLYDGSTQVVTVDDVGNVGIGTEDPNFPLEIYSNNTSTNNQLRIEQDGTGDAVMGFALTGTRAYSLGIDNDDSDKFKISTATNLHTNTLLTIDGGSGGKVGIGTDIPGEKLSVEDSSPAVLINATNASGESKLQFGRTGNTNVGEIKYEHSNNAFTFRTNDSADRLRITSTGQITTNVSSTIFADINTTNSNGAYCNFDIGANGANIGYLGSANHLTGGGSTSDLAIRATNNFKLQTGGSTTRLTIANTGQISHSTSSTVNTFATSASNGAYLHFNYGANGALIGYIGAGSHLVGSSGVDDFGIRSANNIDISTGGSTRRVRIDSSGNVLFGTTDTSVYNNSSGNGIVLRGGQAIDVARNNDLQLTLNRMGNDGPHIAFYKGGGVKSYISTRSNAFCIDVNGTNERLRINSDGRLVVSTNANTTVSFDYAAIHFNSDNSTVAEGLFINNIAANTGDNASISFSTDSGNRKKSAISHVDTGNYGRGDLVFSIDPDADSGELDIVAHEKLRITSGGLVQIDTPGVTAGNGASAKLQVDSSSQYDGLLLGNSATYGTISRGANNGALVYTANAYPANLGGGAKTTHEWWSGSAGGGGPSKIMGMEADGKLTLGDGNELASSYDANLLIDGGSGSQLTLIGSSAGWSKLSFADGSGSTGAKNAGFIYMNHGPSNDGPNLSLGLQDVNKVFIREPGSNRGQLELYGNFNESTNPAIEMNDNGDARKVFLTNSSGDFNALTRNGSQTKGQLKMFESGVLLHNMKNPDDTSTLQTFRAGVYKVTTGSTYTSISPITHYITKGGSGTYDCFEEGNCELVVNGLSNSDHFQPVGFVPRGYNLDATSFGGQWAGEMWIHQVGSQNPVDYGYDSSSYNNWATMSFKCKWDSAHWNAKPNGFWVEHNINYGRQNIGKIDASGTQSQFVIYFLPGRYKIRYNAVRGVSVHRPVSDGAALVMRDGGSFVTYNTLAYSSRNADFGNEITAGSSGAHTT